MINIFDNPLNQQVFIKINVAPKIETYKSYVRYEISIETNDPSFTHERSSSHRRYSEFRIMHKMIEKQFPFIEIPQLPPKAPFKRAFDLEFVKKRQEALELYLAKLLSKKIYLSSRAFHLFLQTAMPITEIKNIVEGKSADVNVNKDVIIHTKISPLKDEENDLILSSNAVEIIENSEVTSSAQGTPSFASDSPIGSKRVSFCDQVTVAEIHTS